MNLWLGATALLAAAGAGWWLLNLVMVVRVRRRVPALERLDPPPPARWPSLTIVIPACNEARDIEAATRSRLADGYPDLQVVLIDDRSDDATGEIMDRLAAEDPRVRVLHIERLPDGWLGKVHALHQGVRMARGDWLLFSDADVYFEPGTLKKTVAFCEQQRIDHLTGIPHFRSTAFLLDCALAMFMRMVCLTTGRWAPDDPRPNAAIGCGAFNLVRRSAFERTPGFEQLKMTVVDDVALGQMMKRSGARCAVLTVCEHVGLHFYRSLGEAARGMEKSVLAAFRFSYARLAVLGVALWVLDMAPLLALLGVGLATPTHRPSPGAAETAATLAQPGGLASAAALLGGLTLVPALLATWLSARWARGRLLPALCFPIGTTLAIGALFRAAILAAWRGGHQWRGVIYSTRELREGNRMEFP